MNENSPFVLTVCSSPSPLPPRGVIEIFAEVEALVDVVIVPLTVHCQLVVPYFRYHILDSTFAVHVSVEIQFRDIARWCRLDPYALPNA